MTKYVVKGFKIEGKDEKSLENLGNNRAYRNMVSKIIFETTDRHSAVMNAMSHDRQLDYYKNENGETIYTYEYAEMEIVEDNNEKTDK